MKKDISRFLNEDGQVFVWPKKHTNKKMILDFIIEKFELETTYSEKEVNDILNRWHTFHDWALLRRSLVDASLLMRDIEGREYRRPEQD